MRQLGFITANTGGVAVVQLHIGVHPGAAVVQLHISVHPGAPGAAVGVYSVQ